jgi:predicted RNA binding protein YcfA (HicA-like mRNA interferase family)
MPRITPIHWKVLECIVMKCGFTLDRHKGTSHRIYTKPSSPRPITIPTYDELGRDIILSTMRSLKIDRLNYFELLEQCK